jgi:hypothetical protein
MSRRWLRVGALGMAVVLAGCAAAPSKPVVEAQSIDSLDAQAPAECAAPPPSSHAAVRLARAVGYGTLGVFLGALQGASEGANWVWGSGGSRSDAVWIGAAAGAGVGFLVGFVTGIAKAGTSWSPEPTTPPTCQANPTEAIAAAEDNIQTEGKE